MFDRISLIAGVVLTLVGRILRQNLLLAILIVVVVTSLVGAASAFFGFSWWGVPVGLFAGVSVVVGGALLLVLSTLNGGGRHK